MTAILGSQPFYRNQRVQLGAVAGLASLALVGFGALAVAFATRPEPAIADVADHARLSVVTEPAPKASTPFIQGKLATLDPAQIAEQSRPPEPVDPALQALLVQERQDQAKAAAEQRAFDERLKADMAGTSLETPIQPTEPSTHSSTSNSEDPADG